MAIFYRLFQRQKNLKEKLSRARVGLALGGGAVLGAAHVGVLRAFEEEKVNIACLSGTSVGALVASLYAFGVSIRQLEETVRKLKWLDVSGVSLSRYGLLSNRPLGEIVKEILGPVKVEMAILPLAILATDISTGEKVVIHEGDLETAVMASAAVPGIFLPVEREGRWLMDGGLVENVPISPLSEMGATVRVGVNLTAKRNYRRPRNIIDLLTNTFDILVNTAASQQLVQADLTIEPDLAGYDYTNLSQVPTLIEEGYRAARKMLAGI
ncbi:MAG: patatin-like phospholipase family protein [Candidatus Omnitrophica bacterium]|nr:patatin-like phospholipase family protein [Candidatus Omnitrophota bacterium]MCM8768114.1 patatin-like phospholipase family protein [Candidatus Omnitrophota bacterium]